MCRGITFGKLVQHLVSSWTTIVELISIYKRLRAFEHRIGGAAANARSQGSSAN